MNNLPARASDAGPEADNTPLCDVCGLSIYGGHEYHGKIVHDGDCYDIIRGKAFRCSCCYEVTGIYEKAQIAIPGDLVCWVCGTEGEYQDKIAKLWRRVNAKIELYEAALVAYAHESQPSEVQALAKVTLEAAKEIK